MTDLELNKEMHRILGLCWHEWDLSENIGWYLCVKCNLEAYNKPEYQYPVLDFTKDWQAFGMAWGWLQSHVLGLAFMDTYIPDLPESDPCKRVANLYKVYNLINSRALSEAMVEFFKE